MLIHPGGATDVGRARKINEDFYDWRLPTPAEAAKGSLFVLADGVGGEAAGEAASRLAVDTFIREYFDYPDPDPQTALRLAVERANEAVHGSAASDRRATTLVAAAVIGDVLEVINVGDSRLYLIRGGSVRQVTLDHSWVQEQVRAGNIEPEAAKGHHLGNVITRWLGQASVEPDLFTLALEEGDRILLCSDGLVHYVEESTIGDVVEQLAPEPAARRLVQLANEGGGSDNITVVVLAIGEGRPRPRSDTRSLPVIADDSGPPDASSLATGSSTGGALARAGRWSLTGLVLVVLAMVITGLTAAFLPRLTRGIELSIPIDGEPIALAASSDGALFIADRAARRIQLFELGLADPTSLLLDPLLLLGVSHPAPRAVWTVGDGDAASPISAIAAGPDGVYVAVGSQILVYSRDGKLTRLVAERGPDQASPLRALAVDAEGRIYLANGTGGLVTRLDAEGRPDPTWSVGSRVELRAPAALVASPDGGLYVADADGGRVIKLDPSGALVQSWNSSGEVSLASPQALARGPDGRLYAADVGAHAVVELAESAEVTPYRREVLGELISLAVDRAGNLYVGNASTRGVVVVRPGGSLVNLPFSPIR